MKIVEKGPAKINLGLDVLGMRPDRYHDVAMVMQSLALADTVTLTDAPELTVTTDRDDLEGGPSNLAYKAAELMGRFARRTPRVHIHIEKKVFLAAGLAGGSTDAAAVLRGLNRYWDMGLPADRLERLGAQIGSDVPFCVRGGTSLATGRGELLTPLPDLPVQYIVLAKPPVSVSTPWAYREYDKQKNIVHPDIPALAAAVKQGQVDEVLRLLGNVLEPVTAAAHPEITEIEQIMRKHGALAALMSGSGPTVFGITRTQEEAAEIAARLVARNLEIAVTKTTGRMKL
ncbi:MAG: 4-(cytidine 5'-diphospho)-2-C-methyl-D-erythritol kinase [Succiniclasticum sp.]|jgi:4-diphosphocytidyl-2-C-methyl-D-erythritol kinase